jgi:D-ribose pyranose/furanose isomerase RbsD
VIISPPIPSTAEWLAFLTPLAVALLAVVNLVTASMAATRSAKATEVSAQHTEQLRAIHTMVSAIVPAPAPETSVQRGD